MAVTMYQISVPVFNATPEWPRRLHEKGPDAYAEKKYDEASLLGYRFYPDMFRFAQQVQIKTDHA